MQLEHHLVMESVIIKYSNSLHWMQTSQDMEIACLIRGNVRTKTECLIGKSGWCSGYHDRLTRDRSRVQSPHPILFRSPFLFTPFLSHETPHQTLCIDFYSICWSSHSLVRVLSKRTFSLLCIAC